MGKATASDKVFQIFGGKLNVSASRVEYTALRKRFGALAEEQFAKAESEIDAAAKDVDDFCENGNAWAYRYFAPAADLASKIMNEKGCYDVDSDLFLKKYLDTCIWDKRFGELCEAVAAIHAEEEEGTQSRSERWHNAGNWQAANQYSEHYAKEKNLNENIAAGALNVLSWGLSAITNSTGKRSAYKKNRDGMLRAIYITIETSVDELLDCMADSGVALDGAKVAKADREKAERLFNNMKSGNLPHDALNGAKMQILDLNPYNSEFYEYIYENEGDKSGELEQVAGFFGFPLDDLKESAFHKRLGECAFATEEETLEYREKALSLAKELRVEAAETFGKIDAKLQEFDLKARTVDGREFATREEAALQRELSAFEKEQDLSSEESALAAKAAIAAKAKDLKIDGEWKLERVDAALKKFDLEARSVDNREFATREEAALQRELSAFEKTQDLSTEELAVAARAAIVAKAEELEIDGGWKLVRVDNALKRFDEIARTTFGMVFDTREEAKNALGDRELFYKGIEHTVRASGEDAFYTSDTAPEKKIINARAAFPVPPDEYILALTDTTLFGSGKTGLAVTKRGLRWANGGSTKTNVRALSWEEIANIREPPKCADGTFSLAPGGVYNNSGSRVEDGKMQKVLSALYGYCKVATFLTSKSAEELAKEEESLPFSERLDRVLMSITDSGFLYGERLSDKKKAKAAKSCLVDPDCEIVAVIDSSLLGTAATAMVIAVNGVYWHNKEDSGKNFIAWEGMADYRKTICVKESNRIVFSQGFGFKAGMAKIDLEVLKNAFLKIADFACSKKV